MAKYHEVSVSPKYRVLKAIAAVLNVIGFIVLAIGLICFIFSLFSSSPRYDEQNSMPGMSPFLFALLLGMMKVLGIIFSIVFGLMFIAYAQFINLFLDIESNQRIMIEQQKQVINGLPDNLPVAMEPMVTV